MDARALRRPPRAAQTTRFRRNAQAMLATQLADHTGGSSACPGVTVLTCRDRALRSGKRCDRRSPDLVHEGARRTRDGARQASALSDLRTGAGLDATSSGRPCHATSCGDARDTRAWEPIALSCCQRRLPRIPQHGPAISLVCPERVSWPAVAPPPTAP